MRASTAHVIRWSPECGPITLKGGGASVACGDVTATATVASGTATLKADDAASLMPEIGTYALDWGGVSVTVERVGGKYATPDDLLDYGDRNGDGFDRYGEDMLWDAIGQAEDAIDDACRRSFVRRAMDVRLPDGFSELPVVDAQSIGDGAELVSDRQATADSAGTYRVVYGFKPSARLTAVTVKLAASYLRPRVGSENTRGTSVDGVYVSYTLATGTDGSWTGLPDVDAWIEEHRSRRVVVA